MNLDLADVGALLVIVAPYAVLLILIFVVADGSRLEDLIVPRADIEWPHVVEEKEPARWRIELLTPRDRRVDEPTQQRATSSTLPSAIGREPRISDRSSRPAA